MQNEIIEAVREHAKKFEVKNAELARQNAELAERLAGIEQEVVSVKSAGIVAHGDAGPSPVAAFIQCEQLQRMRDGAPTTGRVTLQTGGLKLLSKAIANANVGQVGDSTYNVQPQRDLALWNNPRRKLSLFDVLPSIPVSTGAFEYIQLTGFANASAMQLLEGDLKAEQAVPTTVQTANIATIAAFVRSSTQVMDDSAALGQQLNNLLSYGVMAKAENELINGLAGTGKIKGFLASATTYAATANEAADRIGQAITELHANGWHPSVVVLSPHDWFAIQTARNANDSYLLGSPRDPAPPSLWGVPVITTPSLAAGMALVLDASQCAVLDRQEVMVASSMQDGDNFTRNMVTTRAECRIGLAVFSPGAVLSVNLTPTT